MRRLLLAFACLLFAGGCTPAKPAAKSGAAPRIALNVPLERPVKLTTQHLPNAVRVHEKVISGGLPEGDAAFAELQALGVQTVISVDGAQPDVATAQKFGLRYVHLPHGYNGIPDQRAMELAKAVRDLPGPIYIHCHHGKHRSPVAAAVACVGAGLIDESQALPILETAGTSPHYRGLYDAAKHMRAVDGGQLDALRAEFPESVKPAAMAEAMVALEHTHDHLQQLADHRWRPLATKPDLDAAHEALLLREHFTELLRTEMVKQTEKQFQDLLRDSEAAALELESALVAGKQSDLSAGLLASAGAAYQRVTKNCKACHQTYRDVPLTK